ncbi:MAG TPA: type IVB secretion system protein IcmH/DotU [Marinagarivorans sp.]
MSDSPFHNNSGQSHTVLVPRPGAATVAPNAGGGPQTHAPVTPNIVTPSHQRNESPQAEAHSLSSAALTLLSLIANLQATPQHDNVPNLHKHITEEIKRFERTANAIGAPQNTVLAARYLLCSALDEVVLNTPWGSQSGWSQHSLLSLFHKETSGGEKSFIILQKMLGSPGQNIEILELFFYCLGLGFMGKYRFNRSGRAELEQIQDNLYATLRAHRPDFDTDLSPNWQTVSNTKPGLAKYIPLWVILCLGLAILVLSFSGFRYWLYQSSQPVKQTIETEMLDSQTINTRR